MSSRHTWPTSAHPLEDEDLLEEILLRLPPQPSSLPRASLVCKRWRIMLFDPQFLRRFRKHHREPPLFGFFIGHTLAKPVFTAVMDSPDCIPPARFSIPRRHSLDTWHFMGCRHGLGVLVNDHQREIVVWDPLTGQQHRIPYPTVLHNTKIESFRGQATVLCVDTEDEHVHGDCFFSPFKVILICEGAQKFACIYESTSGVWAYIASTAKADIIFWIRPSILIGNVLYWLFYAGDILAFDFERQTLEVIEMPTNIDHTNCWSFQILQTNEDNALHLAVVSKLSIQIWKRKSSSEGVLGWVLLQKNNQLEELLPRGLSSYDKMAMIVGYDEVSNVIVLTTYIGDFMLQLQSMQFRRISESGNCRGPLKVHYPYRNFYTAGRGVGWKWVDKKL